MATYPYRYLAEFITDDFKDAVVAQAVKNVKAASGVARQRLDRAVRNAGLSAPGFRPGKVPLQQVAKPLLTPVSKNSRATPFTTNEEIAYAIFALWLESKPELKAKTAAFLQEKEMPVREALPPEGFEETIKLSEIEVLAGEMGAPSDGDEALYDDTALMLVCLLGRAPVAEAEETEDVAAPEDEGGATQEQPQQPA